MFNFVLIQAIKGDFCLNKIILTRTTRREKKGAFGHFRVQKQGETDMQVSSQTQTRDIAIHDWGFNPLSTRTPKRIISS